MRYAVAAVAAVLALGGASPAAAHTESDVVAVPAGEPATVRLRPTHGCGDSPTVAVRIRAPFPDATAGDVEGWSATAEADGSGNTVVEWSGGVLPADDRGAFPVEFVAPDAPGTLLTFPAIQRCENGEELAWISGDPTDDYPAPRVLVLPAGSEPAETIDDVPVDAPGRDQLVAIVDVDNPSSTTTTAPPTSPPTTTAPETTTGAGPTAGPPTTSEASPATTTTPGPTSTDQPATTESVGSAGSTGPPTSAAAEGDGDGDGGAPVPLLVGAGVVVAGGAGTAVALARRRAGATPL